MASFALTNALILGFIVLLGQHKLTIEIFSKIEDSAFFQNIILPLRREFWKASHFTFDIVRTGASVYGLLIVILFGSYVMLNKPSKIDLKSLAPPDVKNTGGFYTGIYLPQVDSAVSILPLNKIENEIEESFSILSMYHSWGPESIKNFPDTLLAQVYQRGAIPMITWEPFTKSFPEFKTHPELQQNRKVCKAIGDGVLDDYIKSYALKIKLLKKPVFIRFAHEPDNPVYPWSPTGGNSPQEYVIAWQHVVSVFTDLGVSNVTWVWNPWDYSSIDKYYPGTQYVDWLGITALNYGLAAYDGKWRSFTEIYAPFRKKFLDLKKPVMLAEFGSTGYGGNQVEWLSQAFKSIQDSLTEIKSTVFFYSNHDKYWITSWRPDSTTQFIDWTFNSTKYSHKVVQNYFSKLEQHKPILLKDFSYTKTSFNKSYRSKLITGTSGSFQFIVDGKPFYIQGVAYNPGHDWRDGNYPLTYKQLNLDFKNIKAMGANAIRRYNPGIYDKNILKAANNNNLKVLYGFWFDPQVDYFKDTIQVQKYINNVEEIVLKYKDYPAVLAWGIGNETSGLLKHYYSQPYLFQVRMAYMQMIEKMAQRIHIIDPNHPVLTVLEHSWQLPIELATFHDNVPSVDMVGINSYYRQQINKLQDLTKRFDSDRPYLVSEFGPKGYWNPEYSMIRQDSLLMEDSDYQKAMWYSNQWSRYIEYNRGSNIGGFAFTWRDRLEGTGTWFGLTDFENRRKPAYYSLQGLWTNKKTLSPLHDVFIQIPATHFIPGKTYEFKVKTENNNINGLKYHWYLCREEYLERVGVIKPLAGGMRVKVTMPNEQSMHRLYLYISDNKGNVVSASEPIPIHKSTLTAK
jgi:hypothetical protein